MKNASSFREFCENLEKYPDAVLDAVAGYSVLLDIDIDSTVGAAAVGDGIKPGPAFVRYNIYFAPALQAQVGYLLRIHRDGLSGDQVGV